jgi:hypothetical protein
MRNATNGLCPQYTFNAANNHITSAGGLALGERSPG